jgi:hypothetical protein
MKNRDVDELVSNKLRVKEPGKLCPGNIKEGIPRPLRFFYASRGPFLQLSSA